MKNTMNKFAAAAVLGSLIALAALTVCYAQGGSDERTIEGTWKTVVTPSVCQTGAAAAPAFPGILAFAKGGTLSGTSATVTSAYGVWERSGGPQNYTFAFTNLRYNASGAVIGSQIVRQTAVLTQFGSAFTSTGTVEFLDTNGNVVGTGCATSTGARFQ